jgi:hypothetical protein
VRFTPKQLIKAFTRGTVWELGRAQVGQDKVAVWKTRVQGEAHTTNASLPVRLTFKSCQGMKPAAAAEIVKSWEISGGRSGEPTGAVGWLAANVGITVGQSPRSTHLFESSRWQERDCQTDRTDRSKPPKPG